MSFNVELKDDVLIIDFPRSASLLNTVRALPVRRYDAPSGTWHVAHVRENWEALKLMGVSLRGIPAPTRSAFRVERYKKGLAVFVPPSPENIDGCRTLPDYRKWDPDVGAWVCAATPPNVQHIVRTWPKAEWQPDAVELRDAAIGHLDSSRTAGEDKRRVTEKTPEVRDYKFGEPPPYDHQVKGFVLARDREAFALFMEQRTGKTRLEVDDACYNFARGRINAVLVICPNSVKDPWDEEIADKSPPHFKHSVVVYSAGMKRGEKQRLDDLLAGRVDVTELQWLVMNVESFSSDTGKQHAEKLMARYDVLMIVDESQRIKAPSAKRTKSIVKLGRRAKLRRILTGTPVTQGPLDLYTQFKFLDPNILGFSSFYSFRNHFAIMGGWNNKQVVSYANLEELQRLIEPHVFRVTRDEVADMPPKLYSKRVVELTTQQRKAYSELAEDMLTTIGDRPVTVSIVLTQLLRLQQVVGGFLPVEVGEDELTRHEALPLPGGNPKLDALVELTEEVGKAIIWARFRPEIDLIARRLRQEYGEGSVVEFHGGTTNKERTVARRAFQDAGSDVRFFVGQTETGGLGLALHAATTVVYFSNSFSLESRLQSEDRPQSLSKTESVEYIDLVAKNTIDTKLLIPKLRAKQNIANLITGDSWKEWL